MSDEAAIALKAFKEGQKGKHHPIWGSKDVDDAWYAGIAWQKVQSNKHTYPLSCVPAIEHTLDELKDKYPTQNRGDDKSLVEDGIIPTRD